MSLRQEMAKFFKSPTDYCLNSRGLLTKKQLCKIFASRCTEQSTGYHLSMERQIRKLREDYPGLRLCTFYGLDGMTAYADFGKNNIFINSHIKKIPLKPEIADSHYIAFKIGRITIERFIGIALHTAQDIGEEGNIPIQDIDLISRFQLYHETAHALDKHDGYAFARCGLAESDNINQIIQESFADSFAILRLIQESKDQSRTINFIEKISQLRTDLAFLNGDIRHLTSFAIDGILSKSKQDATRKKTKTSLADLYQHLDDFLPSPPELALVSNKLKAIEKKFKKSKEKNFTNFLFKEMVSCIHTSKKVIDDSYFLYLAAKFLKPRISSDHQTAFNEMVDTLKQNQKLQHYAPAYLLLPEQNADLQKLKKLALERKPAF